MGDDQGREPLHEVLESVLHQRFALRVEAARRLIQDQDLGALQDDPSDGHPLALAGTEGNAALTHHLVEPIRQVGDELGGMGGLRRLFDLRLSGIQVAVDQVLTNGPGEEHRLLRNDADLTSEFVEG